MDKKFQFISSGAAATLFGFVMFLGSAGIASAAVVPFDNASIGGGQATLISDAATTTPFGGLTFDDANGTTFASLSTLSADFDVTTDSCGGGSPRISIGIDTNNDNVADGFVFIAFGPSPSFAGCTAGMQNTGNFIGNTDAGRFDFSQLGGSSFTTYANAPASVMNGKITEIDIVVDGSWNATATGGDGKQTVLIDNVNINGTVYDFATPQFTVTLDKFIDGHAASTTGATADFPMQSTWTAQNLDGGVQSSGNFDLGPTGFNSTSPYEAITSKMDAGADYTAHEITGNATVGDCSSGAAFTLEGYSIGDTLAAAEAATVSTTAPSFTNLQQNEFVIVHNKTCVNLPAPVNVSPVNGTILTTAQWDKADWTDVTDALGGIQYFYESSNSSTTNPDGSFTSPAFQSSALAVSEIPTPGTPAGTWFWHARAEDAGGNFSPWGTATEVIVDNSAPGPITMCPANTTAHLVETDTVNSASASPITTGTLANGQQYLVDSTGTWQNSNLNVADTAFASVDNFVTHMMGYNITPFFLGPNEFQLQINGQFVNWGGYQPTHEYGTLITGAGAPVTLGVFDGDSNTNTPNPSWYGDNSGNLTVNIYSCDLPPPPPPADACENTDKAPTGFTLVKGTSRNNTVTLNDHEMYVGRGGNDKITAGDGDHIICTGNGNDTVTVGNGNNVIDAGGGNNTITTGDGTQNVTTADGNDTITTGAGNDTINAGGGNNQVNSGAGDDTITTGSGNDTINASDGSDTCSLGGGHNHATSCEN